MDTLHRIAKHICSNKLSEAEVYNILHEYVRGQVKDAWLRGWMRRSGLVRVSKRALERAEKKNSVQEEEMQGYEPLNLSAPVHGKTLVELDNHDYKEVRHLSPKERINIGGVFHNVRGIKITSDNKYLINT